MKISAVIPTYNNAEYIEEAIDSILAQTHPIDEIIIIDDGSSDNTAALIKAIKQKTNKLSYIKQGNQGPSAARNQGIEIANGDWIAFLDADDRWPQDKIALQIAALQREPSLQLIAGDMAETDQQGNVEVESVLAKHQLLQQFQGLAGRPLNNALTTLVEKNFIPTGTVLVKRTALKQAGGFNPDIRFGEDLELWAKIACHHPITCLPERLMYRRQHGANATENTGPMLEDLVKVMGSIRHYGAEQLKQQGTKPNTLVASALSDLGYWHFSQGDYKRARKVFTASLKEQPSKRALFYATACLLPHALIKQIKALKQSRPTSPH
ncbi:MAG: glycosyltransferase [Candidatus Reddybacter sp.]